MKFSKDDKISGPFGTFIIKEVLGEGGQGEVYLVTMNNKDYAFKYYKEYPGDDFRYNLKNNIEKGSPSSAFLWPKILVDFEDDNLGYLMDLRPKNYDSFISYLNGKTQFKDLKTLLSWCIELCIAFKKLHEQGFSYQDLNDGSFFLDSETGNLLICDNDNVTADKKNLGILGKMRYMAPEILREDKNKKGERQMPDIHSDRFSLAVILFLALCLGNPFEGERLKKYDFVDEKAEFEMFGSKPLFIYHKTNKENRPIRGYHTAVIKRWPNLPIYVKEAFHKTFVDGLVDRENGRTTELEWLKVLTKYRDELLTCKCGNEFILGFKEKKILTNCPYCNQKVNKLPILEIGKEKIVLEPGKKLYRHHLDKYSSNYNEVLGEVIINKNNPKLWGIKLNLETEVNLSDTTGKEKVISGRGVIPIINNLSIDFKTAKGEIKYGKI